MGRFKLGGYLAFVGLLAAIMPGGNCVQILSMAVPEAVEAGSEDIVLDCDFEYTEEEKMQLDIKWYFNNEPEPIYQWIPSQKGPQLISELFRDHVNLDFEINEDSFKKHRALHIKNPLPHFSGTYMCKVSSFVDEDFDQKDLLIYAPPSSIKFSEMLLSGSEPLNVTCIASGMYPQPNATLTWGHNSSDSERVENEPVVTFRDDGLVDIILSTSIAHNELDVITVIGCQISLPGTKFSIQEQTIFYPLGLEPTEATAIEEPTIEGTNMTVDAVWMEVDNETNSDGGECDGNEGKEGSGGGGCINVDDYVQEDINEEEEKEEEDRPDSGASHAGAGFVLRNLASILTAALLMSSSQLYLNRN